MGCFLISIVANLLLVVFFPNHFAKLARNTDVIGSKKPEKRLCLDSFFNEKFFISLPFTQFIFYPQGLDSPPHLPLASPPHAGVAKRINLVNCVRHGDKQFDGDMVTDRNSQTRHGLQNDSTKVERYISVVHPHHWFRQLSSAVYIVPVVLLTVVWNICRSFLCS